MKKIHIILYTIYIFIDIYKIWTSILKNEVNFHTSSVHEKILIH